MNGPGRARSRAQMKKPAQYGVRNNYSGVDLLHNVIRVCNDWTEHKEDIEKGGDSIIFVLNQILVKGSGNKPALSTTN